MQTGLKGRLSQMSFVKERKEKASVESKMTDQQLKATNKTPKSQDSKNASRSCNSQGGSCKKQTRKGQNPTQFDPATFQSPNHAYSNTRFCKNSACQAVLSVGESFCRKCSCCLCHRFDYNKDPSLWLVCESGNTLDDSCGLACHVECAFQHGKVGVVNPGQFMQLDGSYWCSACGKVSGILRCWKTQLGMAKDARRVKVLCHRIFLSYRLLSGTSRFKALHEIVKDAKNKLEAEVGPINEISCDIGSGWGVVSRLCVASDVQKLCADAIGKADEWPSNASNWASNSRVDSLPTACRFRFEDATSSSVAVALIEIPTVLTDIVKGYKLWYWRSQQDPFPKEPVRSFLREQRRIVICDLQPCTEYTFRIVSFTEAGDLDNSEASCVTKSMDMICKKASPSGMVGIEKENMCLDRNFPDIMVNSRGIQDANGSPFGFNVRGAGRILHPVDTSTTSRAVESKQSPPVHRELDLNVASVPDLNEDIAPAFESSGDEDNDYTLEQAIEDNSNVEAKGPCKRPFRNNEETFDCDSTLVNGSPVRTPAPLDENYEGSVKTIRWLECQGHIKQDFRLKFLTWFSLGSTEQERRVVSTFIHTLSDEPKSLAGQLLDSFSDIVVVKRPRHSFSGNLS